MATAAQITANQMNANALDRAENPEGKTAAARNSLKHGLSGAFTVLPHEDQDEFDILVVCLRDGFHPANEHESFLVEQMVQSRWRLARARRLETAIFDQMLNNLEQNEANTVELIDGAVVGPDGQRSARPRAERTQKQPSAFSNQPSARRIPSDC